MSSSPKLTCKEIVEEILKGGVARERMTQRVFEEYKGFLFSIGAKNKVPHQIAYDAYAEAVSQLISKIESGGFSQQSKKACSNYLYKICHNKCVDYIRREVRKVNMEYIDDSEDPNKYEPIPEEEQVRMKDILELYGAQIGETCRNILKLYMKGFNPEEIAKKLGMAGGNSVSATKSKCIKELRSYTRKRGNNELL